MGGENSQNKPLGNRKTNSISLDALESSNYPPKEKRAVTSSPVAFRTDARVTVHGVRAVGTVSALVILAIIKVNVAVLANVPWGAVTPVPARR